MKRLWICLLIALLLALINAPSGYWHVRAAQALVDGPTEIIGSYTTTEPTYIESGAEPRVYLVDLASEVNHDLSREVTEGSVVQADVTGTVAQGSFRLDLPILPQGPYFNLDKSESDKKGVQVSVITLTDSFDANDIVPHIAVPQSNGTTRWDGPHRRISGGNLFVWSPDDGEKFPTDFGPDQTLFTADDPLGDIPAGWSMVNLDSSPFQIIRSGALQANVIESVAALEDYSQLDYGAAWDKLFTRVSTHYPFTDLKKIGWQAIHDKIQPLIDKAIDDDTFILAMEAFATLIPDTHVEVDPLAPSMQRALVGEIGIGDMVLTDDGQIVVRYVANNGAAARAGMKPGAVISQVNGQAALQALDAVSTIYSGASTPWYKHSLQLNFFLRGSPGMQVNVTFQNAGEDAQPTTLTLRNSRYVVNYAPLFATDPAQLVVEGKLLPSNIGYIKIHDYYQQRPLEYRLFVHYLQAFIDQDVKAIIIDDRDNGGGFAAIGNAIAGHFTLTKIITNETEALDDKGQFTVNGANTVYPEKPNYSGPVAVLINAQSVSEADFFAYTMKQFHNVILVGDSPTAGAGGAIQEYKLPGDYHFQAPEFPAVDTKGNIIIEGTGVPPTIRVPVTVDSVRSSEDSVLNAAVSALLDGKH